MAFKTATREKSKLRLALDGPTGAGKTLTALRMAMELARHEAKKANRQPRVAVVDTESGTARKYVGDVHDGHAIEFDVDEPASFSPTVYTNAVIAAARAGYDVVVIDSLSHAWNGTDGALALVDKKANGGNSFTAWKDVTPLQNQMVESIIRTPIHVIVTMRSKMEYVLETGPNGKAVPRKVGLAPIQRQGIEYEFDILIDLDTEHIATMAKTRCSAIDGKVVDKPGAELMQVIIHWLEQGNDIPQELLDTSRLVDAVEPAQKTGAAGAQAAAVSDGDLEARMAAKRAAMSGGATGPAAGTAPTTTAANATHSPLVDTPANAAPVGNPIHIEINALFDELGAPDLARQAACQKRGADTLDGLCPAALANLLEGLKALKRGETPPAIVCNPRPVDTAAAAAASGTSKPTPITGAQADRIQELFRQLEVPAEARVAIYQKRGVVALNDLTSEQADGLIHNLVGKLTGFDQSSAFTPGTTGVNTSSGSQGVSAATVAAPAK